MTTVRHVTRLQPESELLTGRGPVCYSRYMSIRATYYVYYYFATPTPGRSWRRARD